MTSEMRTSSNTHIDRLLILLILLAGGILRFFDYTHIPFTHDEFSAIFRTGFDSFRELISKGVMVDTHPAGVQVFLNYWIGMTGISEPLVKLPFTLMSLASVYLVYSIGRKWFSSTTGLLAAAYLAFLQYPVMYGQIARPYASGLFLVLAMAWFWTNLMLHPGRKYYLNLTGYIVFSALCAYNHHFSLLFAGIAGITGLFLTDKTRRLAFLLSWIAIILLYLPHIPVFLAQLKQGGIGGWLSKPRPDFILDYLAYAFQFSWFVYSTAVLIAVLSFLVKDRHFREKRTMLIVAWTWFILPLLIGYLYSVFINPVLQYSVLIFSFPFLLMALFGFAGDTGPRQKIFMLALISLTVIPSLILERKHFVLFYHSPYREIVLHSKEASDSLGRDRCYVYLDSYRNINDYYLGKPEFAGFRADHVRDFGDPPALEKVLGSCNSEYFIYGCNSTAPPVDYSLIRSKYPFLQKHLRFNEGEFCIFSKTGPGSLNEYYFSSVADFASNGSGWHNFRETSRLRSQDGRAWSYRMDSLEFSPTFRGPLRDICRHKNDIIDFTADVEADSLTGGAWLQVCIYSGDSLLKYVTSPVKMTGIGNRERFFCSMRLADIEWRHHSLFFQAFIWNPGRHDLLVRRMEVRLRHGNPWLYSLTRKIER